MLLSAFADGAARIDYFSLIFFSYHLMPQPGIELTAAELHLLEGPLKDALPTQLHGCGEFTKFYFSSDFTSDRLHRGVEREGRARHPRSGKERLLGDVLVQEELRAAVARIGSLHQSRLQAKLQGQWDQF